MADDVAENSERDASSSRGLDALDILLLFARNKVRLFLLPPAATIVAYLAALLLPSEYLGQARVTPPIQSTATASTLLSQVGSIVGGLTGSPSFSTGSLSAAFGSILQSNSVYDAIIRRFDLQEVYSDRKLLSFSDKLDLVRTRDALASNSSIVVGALDGIVTISVYDRDPIVAASMANAFVEELVAVTNRVATTEASQRRKLFELQLDKARQSLLAAEEELRKIQERTGIIQIDNQSQAIIQSIADLRAQIAIQETNVSVMRSTFATAENPDYVRALQRLAGMRNELTKLERSKSTGAGDIFIPTAGVPEAGLQYGRSFRAVKLNEALYLSMSASYQAALIDEARETTIVQVVDSAIPLDKASKPNRPVLAVAVGILTFLTVLLVCLFRAYSELASKDPEQRRRFSELAGLLSFRRRV
ncbi:MAG: hypothetical protein AB7R40_25415 [Nitrospiraceae bacterium]